MLNLLIQTGLPIPAHQGGVRTVRRAGNLVDEFRKLNVDDSMFIAGATVSQRKGVHGFAKKAGIKVTYRSEKHEVRVWRLE